VRAGPMSELPGRQASHENGNAEVQPVRHHLRYPPAAVRPARTGADLGECGDKDRERVDQCFCAGRKIAARKEEQVSGELPRTTSGVPSYSLAKSLIKGKADELLWALQEEYGLTDLEMADVVSDIGHMFLRGAVSDQQERSEGRQGAIV